VDLWSSLPETVPPPPIEPVEPQPEPVAKLPPEPKPVKAPEPVKTEPAPKPQPVKLEPAPKPQPVVKEAPLPKAPDIALEKKKAEEESLKKMKALQAAEEKALEDAARAEAEAMKKARDKQLAEQKKRELLHQMEEEDLMQRMMEEEAAKEMRQTRLAAAQVAASKRQAELERTIGQYRDKISATVRGNTRLPDTLKGNPEVRCLVKLLPTGEVQSVRVTQSSGNATYDEAVVRAIEKSSPLPLPDDRDARAAFVPELSFIHHPKE
jgi:colicin import membrane protein